MDHQAIVKTFRDQGQVTIKEGNGKTLTLLKSDSWSPEMGQDWLFLLFDLFQIRTVAQAFSEVSLDIVEFATKPTIYHSPASSTLEKVPLKDGNVRFAVIRDANWGKLLFAISQPVLVKIGNADGQPDFQTDLYFPLLGPNTKEMFLGPEGDIKIIDR